ncbi:NACHT domain-containing protein [Brasilonema sp. UFV-L1]|uniref:NACHT C-terminal helical domain 2-containing protein n=1 Tax=Brasilonema sp. UFV-L1 TaxID=2234130 RepID=UPI00145CC2CA|nr:NACHT domain-containing protein [Brasilonema sp. UFV-L1]NMG08053.1 hypothetical protein [Brasilonema sp. UFV-L1]
MPRNIRWDESVKENTQCLVEVLLFHADDAFKDEKLKSIVNVEWVTENKLRVTGFEDKQTSGKRKRTVEVGTKKEYLLKLLHKADKSLRLPKPKDEVSKSPEHRELDEIQTALDCLNELGVREDEKSAKNKGYWKFTLTLKHQTVTPEENLEVVKRKWREHSKTNSLERSQTPQTTDKSIYCQSICHKKLEKPQESARLKCEAPEMGFEVDTLVPQVRSRAAADIGYIEQVGKMRMFRINYPVPVTDVYVNLNILKQISSNDFSFSNRHKNSDDDYSWRSFDRQGLGSTQQKEVPALETIHKHRKLMVLGKPGSGKTTLLKSLATACIYKNLGWNDPDYIPVFIELRKFAKDAAEYKKLGHEEFSLFDAIQKLFKQWKVAPEGCKRILEEGRTLILLDGLDEIPTSHSDFVTWQVRHFCQDFAKNRFIITCRTQSVKYCFDDSFTDVEIANFTQEQVCKFVHHWFTVMVGDTEAKELIQNLNTQLLVNRPVGELAVTPILLNLICYVFWAKQGDLPTKRSELYDECLKGLLEGEWDQSRGVKRDSELSLDEKEKLLAQVAYTLFENNDYFPRQRKLEELIVNYLQTQRSEAKYILELLESQHGLLIQRSTQYFSFSHLTFHEFFTAKYIVSSPNLQEVFQRLVTHITEPRWREVFLLTVEMLDHTDNLLQLLQLMRCQIDKLLAGDEKLQQFLCWVEEKSLSVKTSHNPAVIRAFYFDIGFDLAQNFTACRALSCAVNQNFAPCRDLVANPFNKNFGLSLFPGMDLDDSLALIFINTCDFGTDRINMDSIFDRATDCNTNPNIQCELKQLKDQLSDFFHENSENFKQWWQENSQAWIEKLRSVMINHRNIGHDWKFSELQKQLLKQYYDANKQLVDCLNSDCCISLKVRQEIENTLLLPIIRNIPP